MKIFDVLTEVKLHRISEPDPSEEVNTEDEFDLPMDDESSGENEFDLPMDDELSDEDPLDDEKDPSEDLPEFDPTAEGGQMPGPSQGGNGLSSASVSTPTDNPLDDTDNAELSDELQDPDADVMDNIAGKTSEDPNKQGLIRSIKGAKLVYKRQTEDGTYSELWVYNSDKDRVRDNINTRKAILAGTDITSNKTSSPDGAQTYELWNSGNVEMLLVKGLPN